MANDITTLRPRLAVSLRDPDMEVWESDELTDLLQSATAMLYPKVARPMSVAIYPVAGDDEDYPLPDGLMEISRVDVGEAATDTLSHTMPGGTWEIYGDPLTGDGTLFINRNYLNPSRYLIVHGYGLYDLVENLPPDQYVPFILAHARADAIRTMLPKRASFEKWLTLNQKENVSVNELSQMLAQAEAEVERYRARMKTWRKPKPA